MQDRRKVIDRDIEKHWVEVERQKMTEYDEKMRAKLEQEYKLKQQNAREISEQLENFKLNFIKTLKEEMLEGELIKRQTEEDLEREKLREVQRLQLINEVAPLKQASIRCLSRSSLAFQAPLRFRVYALSVVERPRWR